MSALRLEILETLPSQTPDDQGLIAQWLADRGFSANTQAAYLGDLHDLLGYIGKSFEAITLDDVRCWHAQLCSTGRSARTRRRKLDTVRSFFSYYEAIMRLAGRSYTAPPLKLIRVEKFDCAVSGRVLGREAMEKMAAAGTRREALAVRLLYYTGLRVSELAALRFTDVRERRLEDGSAAGMAVINGKGNKTREVGIPRKLWAELQEYRQAHYADKAGLVLGGWTRHTLYNRIRELARLADVELQRGHASPHCFRHGHATDVLQQHPELLIEVSQQLGHSSVAMTQRVYTHLLRNQTSADVLEDQCDQG